MRASLWIPLFVGCLFLWGCSPPQTPSPTPTPTAPPSPSPSLAPTLTPTLTASPEPTPAPRKLTICMGAEPETLYIYGGSMYAQSVIFSAIYDGPIDSLGYAYQPVILEKLPSLAGGDARIGPVTVQAGDRAVDAEGEPVTLVEGVRYRPAGCRAASCARVYQGGEVQMDQLSADFALLPDLKWSDGKALTASDSTFSYQVAASMCRNPWYAPGEPASIPCGTLGLNRSWDKIPRTASYTTLDSLTTRWTGLPGYLDPDYMTNFAHPLPRHRLVSHTPDELYGLEDARATPLAWGPYMIVRYEPGQYVRLARNPHYFRAAEGLPKFDTLIFKFIRQNDANYEKLAAGECDLLDQEAAWAYSPEMQQHLLDLDAAGQLQAHIVPGTVWEHLDFGLQPLAYDDGYQAAADRPDFFGDPRTRQALALCLDRPRLVAEVLHGFSPIPDSYLPLDHPLANPALTPIPYDPAAGAALLEQTGWLDPDDDPSTPRIARGVPRVPEGIPFTVSYWTTTSTQRQQASDILAESLAGCGVQVELAYFGAQEFFGEPAQGQRGMVFSRAFDLVEFAWLTGIQPPCDLFTSENLPGPAGDPRYPRGWEGQNNTGYQNPQFDAACQAALEALPGEPGYVEAHYRAQEIFAADLPVVPLFFRLKMTAARADFCGYQMDSTTQSDFWNLEAFDDGAGCK